MNSAALRVQRIYSDCEFMNSFPLFHLIYTKHLETPDVEYDSKIQKNSNRLPKVNMTSLDYMFDTAVPYVDNDVDGLVENGHISNRPRFCQSPPVGYCRTRIIENTKFQIPETCFLTKKMDINAIILKTKRVTWHFFWLM